VGRSASLEKDGEDNQSAKLQNGSLPVRKHAIEKVARRQILHPAHGMQALHRLILVVLVRARDDLADKAKQKQKNKRKQQAVIVDPFGKLSHWLTPLFPVGTMIRKPWDSPKTQKRPGEFPRPAKSTWMQKRESASLLPEAQPWLYLPG